MVRSTKIDKIKAEVRKFLAQEEMAEDEGHSHVFNEEERREEAIGYCALKLNLQEQTVERYWEIFEMEML